MKSNFYNKNYNFAINGKKNIKKFQEIKINLQNLLIKCYINNMQFQTTCMNNQNYFKKWKFSKATVK